MGDLGVPCHVIDFPIELSHLELDSECPAASVVDDEVLFSKLDAIISEIGPVFPKVCWSSPRDATFMLCDSKLKCETGREVVAVLKASDNITLDLKRCRKIGHQPHLILKPYLDMIDKMTEFRVFVANGRIFGISQRHPSAFYPQLSHYRLMKSLKRVIKETVIEAIKRCSWLRTDRYAIDLFLPIQSNRSRPLVLDFAPWHESTDSLLFSYDELHEAVERNKPFNQVRIVREDGERVATDLSSHFPLEFGHMFMNGN